MNWQSFSLRQAIRFAVISVIVISLLAWCVEGEAQTASETAAACAASAAMLAERTDDVDRRNVAVVVREFYKQRSTEREMLTALALVIERLGNGTLDDEKLTQAVVYCWHSRPQ